MNHVSLSRLLAATNRLRLLHPDVHMATASITHWMPLPAPMEVTE